MKQWLDMVWREALGRLLIFLALITVAFWALVMPRSATKALDLAGKWTWADGRC